MAKYFPLLNQSRVRIELAAGKSIAVPMFPVSVLEEFKSIQDDLTKSETEQEFEQAKQRMLNLIKTVMPGEYHANLDRFPIESLAELMAYLMYGDEDSEPRDDTPKN